MADIIQKLKSSGLVGRSGAGFPVWQKWSAVAEAMADKRAGKKCYVICNASEGEPGVSKDLFILENYPEKVIDGMKIAVTTLRADKGIIYLNPSYYRKLEKKLNVLLKGKNIELFRKEHSAGYIGGEETSMLNHIENERVEPRFRPPYPPTSGLYGCPTLVNNVETFYQVSLINAGRYEDNRFYTINGDCLYNGVFELPSKLSIAEILKKTENLPKFDFFVQVGGDGAGYVYDQDQLSQPVTGSGSITVYSLIKHKPMDLINKWSEFFSEESCGQCTPCREGNYRLRELLGRKDPDWNLIKDILDNLSAVSFCGLGTSSSWAINSFIRNVIVKNNLEKKLPNGTFLKTTFSG